MKRGLTKFGLRAMFIAVTVAAVLVVTMPAFYDWLTNPPSVPLTMAVAAFNESNPERLGSQALTEKEIVEAIKTQLPTLVAAERVKQILRRIVKDQRVPPTTVIVRVHNSAESTSGTESSATHLNFMRGSVPYSIRIRDRQIEE